MYLLDTQTFLWAAMKPGKIKKEVRELLESGSEPVMVSAVSFWEVSIKHRLGKLVLSNTTPEALPEIAEALGFNVEGITALDGASFSLLPLEKHRDPFDRMLVWQAIRRGWTLISSDSGLDEYRSSGLKLISSV